MDKDTLWHLLDIKVEEYIEENNTVGVGNYFEDARKHIILNDITTYLNGGDFCFAEHDEMCMLERGWENEIQEWVAFGKQDMNGDRTDTVVTFSPTGSL